MKIPMLDLKGQYKPYREEINKAISDVIDNARFIKNKSVKSLEEKFAEMHDTKYAVGVSSGTTALYAAMMALGIKEGDEVITTPFTFIATANVIHERGAKPVFVDIDPKTYNIDPNKIEEKITSKTKAILPVHLYGHAAGIGPIVDIAKRHGLKVVEDCAQSHLATYYGKKVGGFDYCGCFSLFPGKNLGCFGDGGMITTNDKDLDKILRERGNNGIPVDGPKYLNAVTGLNFRMDEIKAAIMLTYVDKLPEWTEKRNYNAELYSKFLSSVSEVKLPEIGVGSSHVYHQFTIRAENRNNLESHLKKNDIECNVVYPVPLHLQKAYAHLGYNKGDFPETEKAASEVLSLPIGPHLSEEQISYVCDKIKEFYKK